MAELWYYTNEGKQMDAVTMKELKRLVGDGTLKPTDMVWKEGMPRWIRASSVKELFPDPSAALDKFFTNTATVTSNSAPVITSVAAGKSSAGAPVPEAVTEKKSASPAEKKKGKSSSDDDEPEDTRRPPRRRSEAASGGGSGGMLIILALVAGGGVLLLAMIVGVVILAFSFSGGGEKKAGGDAVQKKDDKKDGGNVQPGQEIKGEVNYVAALQPGGKDSRTFKFRKGANYELTVRTEPKLSPIKPDVDLFVYNLNGAVVASDTRVNPDCLIRWNPNQDGEYRVEVVNLDGATNVQSTVTIKEGAQTDPPPPAGVRIGSGTATSKNALKPGGMFNVKFRVKGGYPAKLTSPTPGISFTVVKDADQNHQIAVQPANNATLNFSVPNTEVVVVRLRNEGKGAAVISVIYDVSPP
jgi:hypothetical protein